MKILFSIFKSCVRLDWIDSNPEKLFFFDSRILNEKNINEALSLAFEFELLWLEKQIRAVSTNSKRLREIEMLGDFHL